MESFAQGFDQYQRKREKKKNRPVRWKIEAASSLGMWTIIQTCSFI